MERALREHYASKAQPSAAPVTAMQSVGQGLMDPVQGGAQLLANSLPSGVVGAVNDATGWVNRQPVIGPITHALGMTPATPEQLNEQTTQREEGYQASREAAGDKGIDWWRLGGQASAGAPLMLAAPAASGLAGAAGVGAVTGGALAALEPVTDEGDFWDGKAAQAATGGALGVVTGPLGLLAGRAIAPRIAPEVRALRAAGVEMTPGQIVGGATRRLEDAATSVPFLGDQIRSAQRNSLETFNRATANRVLAPLGQKVDDATPVGREMVSDVSERIGRAYDAAIAKAKPFGPDQQFAADIAEVGGQFLTPQSQQAFTRALQDKVISRFQGGQIDGATYQTMKSELGRLASNYRGSSTAAEREIGEAFIGVQRAMQGLLARSNPEVAPALKAADAAFAANVRLSDAAGRVAATDGVFTPAQLSSAVRSGDRSLRHGAYARGDALMQDLSDNARSVLPSTVPDSGTPSRIMAMMLGGGAATGMISPGVAAGAGIAYGTYTPAARKAIAAALLANRPGAVQVAGDAVAKSGGLAAALLAGKR
jgi:hypothetical protein